MLIQLYWLKNPRKNKEIPLLIPQSLISSTSKKLLLKNSERSYQFKRASGFPLHNLA
jgi:hypothetical protein